MALTRNARPAPRSPRRRQRARFRGAVLVASIAIGAAVVCGGAARPAIGATAVPIVVYAALGYDEAMTKAFQAATGVPVSLVKAATGPLLVKVQAEKNNPKWTMLWVDGAEPFAALDQEGQLVRGYEPNVPFNAVGRSLIPANKSYVPTGVTAAGTIVYNITRTAAPPTNWRDLLSPAWKGAVGMNNPSISGPAFPFIAGLFQYLGGVPQGQKFLMALKANGLKVYPRNPNTLHALETGEIRLALIQSSAAIGAGTQSRDLRTAFIKPSTPIPSVIGIDARASALEIAEAKQFAEFVFSNAGQEIMKSADPTGDSLFWPVIDGVNPLPVMPPLASIPAVAIDPYKWGAMENSINRWFVDNLVQQ